jgi:Protein of unknown function (DUF4197)
MPRAAQETQMFNRRRILQSFCALVAAPASLPGAAFDLASVNQGDANAALREILTRGGAAAIGKLGAVDGFLLNDRVKIPLPPVIAKAERMFKALGMQKQAEELVVAMNRAAESAVPEAKLLVTNAVKSMTVDDARAILTGGDDSVTRFFKEKTSDALAKKFLPIVKTATAKVGLAEKYNALAGQGRSLGLVKEQDATVEQYVTRKALDGLYFMIAEEEKALRANPAGAASDVLRRVFGQLRK